MPTHKLMCMYVTVFMIASAAYSQADATGDLPDPSVPTISDTHRAFLSRVARRTMRDQVLGRKIYEPGYVPAALEALSTEVIVRARQDGYLLTTAAAGPMPIALATRDAAHKAAEILHGVVPTDLALVNRLLIEIEVVGPE